jgi:transposase
MSRLAGSEVQGVGMSTAQESALAALRAGSSFPKAAEEAGVNRTTVYRWVQRDPAFRAAYNAWQRELADSAHARLLKLSERAVEVLEEALKYGDKDVAYKMLKHLGILRPRKAGPTNEQVLKLQIDLKEKRELRRAELRMLNYLTRKSRMGRRDPRREVESQATPRFMESRAMPGFMEGLQAVIERSEQKKAGKAERATTGANPGEAPPQGATGPAPAGACKLQPDQEMAHAPAPAGAQAADATGRATGEAPSHGGAA